MKKIILFDLDGVLVDTKILHHESLNSVLEDRYKISKEEEFTEYNGLTTVQKIKKLNKEKNLSPKLNNKIWNSKQKISLKKILNIKQNKEKIELFKYIKEQNFKIGVCSNSIYQTTHTLLYVLGLTPFVDLILSGDDVKNKKPHPEIYWKAMSFFGYVPKDVIIFEDSEGGVTAAKLSGVSEIFIVKNINDVNKSNFIKFYEKCSNN